MRIAEMLTAIANWLESPNNEAILLAEYNDECLKVVAESCIEAASALKKAAESVDEIEPNKESKLNSESLDDLAALASAFDASGDEDLKKQASVIDELLLTIAAPPDYKSKNQAAEENRINELKKKYEDSKNTLDEKNKVAQNIKDIENSGYTKDYRIMEAPLKTRYCPDHPGAQITRIEDNVWQCELDKKIYNYESGYDLSNGSHVPGANVANQSNMLDDNTYTNFDTRDTRLRSA